MQSPDVSRSPVLGSFENSPDLDELKNRLIGLHSAPQSRPFNDQIIQMLRHLSKSLLASSEARQTFPDAIAFGNWIRPSQIQKMRIQFSEMELTQGGVRIPRGIAVHFAPGNVEALFAYSWVTSILAGCKTVVRLSSRAATLTNFLLTAIQESAIATNCQPSWLFANYDRSNDEHTRILIAHSNVIFAWGGNATVSELASFERDFDSHFVGFPDRESLLVLDAKTYGALSEDDRNSAAINAARDIYTFGQAACSSPRFIVWLGNQETVQALSEDFYTRLGRLDSQINSFVAGEVVTRENYLFLLSAKSESGTRIRRYNSLVVVESESTDLRDISHPGLGILVAFRADRLDQVSTFLTPHDQTLTHLGVAEEAFRQWLSTGSGPFPRRIARVGTALDFNSRWDGIELLQELTLITTID